MAQQSFDARNLTVNITQGAGALLNTIVPLVGGTFADAVGVITGGAIPGLAKTWKDSTTDQLNLARRKAIFENGVLKEFLYDLQTAGHMGAQSTGNGVRGYSSAPSPGIANVRLAGGSTPYRKILSGLKRGLLIEAALGAGQSNVLAGAFSVNVELGFLIENGEIVGRVKDCMLAGNAFDAFNHIRDISAETGWHGSTELPYVCFESLSVAGRGG